MEDSPWLSIPADDYEAHMGAIGQSAALRQIFADVYARYRPRRLAVLGCTDGADFVHVDFNHTEFAVEQESIALPGGKTFSHSMFQ